MLHKVERENASAGDAKGNFYTLKLICDLKSNDAKLTSLKIDGEEVLTGSIRNIKYKYNPLEEDVYVDYVDIAKIGVSFKDMTQAAGAIESTDGYKDNSDNSSSGDDSNNDKNTINNNGTLSGGGGCNSVFLYSVLRFYH